MWEPNSIIRMIPFQHAGVVMKLAGVCGHVFCGMDRSEPGRFARAVVQQDYSAVTAACMMVKKSVYESAGGMDEAFAVAYNDVDFCLRVRGMGLLVVFTPFAELYHDESKTRGYEDNPEKQKRFTEEKKDSWAVIKSTLRRAILLQSQFNIDSAGFLD